MKPNNFINLGGGNQVTAAALKTIVQLQKNESEVLHEHINELGRAVLFLARNLDGFNPECSNDVQTLKTIVALSNVAAMLQTFDSQQ